jgi:hypothetical protein
MNWRGRGIVRKRERNSKEEGEEEWDKATVIYNQS